jgi:hypothetical protein
VIICVAMWTLLGLSFDNDVGRAIELLSISLGSVDSRTIIEPRTILAEEIESRFVGAVFLANLPQLILSVTYSTRNRIITTFALSRELTRFSNRPTGLRVSSIPYGSQRSEYFLQLPYHIALPVMLLSGILHWLCSQGFFLVSILDGPLVAHKETITLGFSPLAILIVGILGLLIYSLLLACSLLRLTSVMPLSGSCSAVISAMCHQPADDAGNEAVLRPLMWGVISDEDMWSYEKQEVVGVVKTSFSSKKLRQPVDGDLVFMFVYMRWVNQTQALPFRYA